MTAAQSRLSPQSNDFTPYRPPSSKAQPPNPAPQVQRDTPTLPWHLPPPPTHPCPLSLSALNKHYTEKSFPPSEIAHMVERYHTDLGLIDVVLALRDGSRTPSAEAGFYPAPRMDDSEPDNSTVFVGGLSGGIGVELLRVFFLPFGQIDYVKTPEGKGCGFVRFKHRQDAENAIAKMQGFEVESCRFRLSWGRNPNNERPAPASAINPGLIRRLTGYVDPAYAKDLLTCIDSVFDGNTRMFREALEFLNSTVAHSREPRDPIEHDARGSGQREAGGRPSRSWNGPVNRISAYERQPARGDYDTREEPPHYRVEGGIPPPRTSLSAGAQSFDYDYSQGRRQAQNHLPANTDYPEAHFPQHRHDSISATSSDEMYHLELEYTQPEPSPALHAGTFIPPGLTSPRSDETWSDDIDPSFFSPRPTITPAPGTASECSWSCWASPPGYAHANGHVRPGTIDPSQQQQPAYRPEYAYDPARGYSQAYSAAPRFTSAVSSGTPGDAASYSINTNRQSSDPVNQVEKPQGVDPVVRASQGHFGSVGQSQLNDKDGKSDAAVFPRFTSWTSTTTPSTSINSTSNTKGTTRQLGSGMFKPFEPIGTKTAGTEKSPANTQSQTQARDAGLVRAMARLATPGPTSTGKTGRSSTPVRPLGLTTTPPQGGDGRTPIGPRGLVRV